MQNRPVRHALTLLAASALTLGGVAVAADAAQAAPLAISAEGSAMPASGPWSAPPAHGQPPEYKCTVNATAQARLAWIKNTGEPVHLGILVTTNADIHNPYVFVGCTIRVFVDVLGSDGTILGTVGHDAFAGAVFDPQGNNKSYTWVDEAPVDPLDLSGTAGMEIRLQNIG